MKTPDERNWAPASPVWVWCFSGCWPLPAGASGGVGRAKGFWRGSLVEAGLLVLVGVSFFSADQPGRYWYSAWLISWEWVGVFVAFCLVRQLFRNEAENDGLLAAMLATGVCLAATGIMQDLLNTPAAAPKPDTTVAQVFGVGQGHPTNVISLRGFTGRPTSYSELICLILPALFVAGLIYALGNKGPRNWLMAGCVLVAPYSLSLSQLVASVVAVLAAAVAAAILLRRFSVFGLVLVTALLFSIICGFDLREYLHKAILDRLDAWTTTSTLIREHPWFGVGPGNFSREYPAFLTSAAQSKIAEPPGFLLEIAATYGLIGLAAVVTTIAFFFWRVIPAMAVPEHQPPEETSSDSETASEAYAPGSPRINWEFYLGGMAGLSLGFMIRFNPSGGWNALAVESLDALFRFVVWFGAFALLERVPWTNRARLAATSMGVAGLLVYLLFNSGFTMPSLALPLWVMAALALNATPSPVWPPRHWIGMILPAPLLGVLCLVFLVVVFYPAASAASSIKEARSRYPVWRDKLEPRWRQKVEEGSSAEEKLVVVQDADARLKKFILGPLENAREVDRGNAAICTELAFWYAKEWQLYAALKEFENKRVQYAVRERQAKAGQQAVGAAAGGYQAGTGARRARNWTQKAPQAGGCFTGYAPCLPRGRKKPRSEPINTTWPLTTSPSW